MYKFTKLNKSSKTLSAADFADWSSVMELGAEFREVLFDDFFYGDGAGFAYGDGAGGDLSTEERLFGFIEKFEDLIKSAGPYFWVVRRKRDNAFAGFVYLYGFYGASPSFAYGASPSSAHVGCCFKREFWGAEALKIGRKFLKYCFCRMPIYKLKCETMRSNRFVAGFLKRLGFGVEGILEDDTFVFGKSETLILWGLGREKWTKKRTLGVLDYTSRSINNKVIVANFSKPCKKN